MPRQLSLSDVTSKGPGLPSRIILHGVEKIGKSSFGANCPSPFFAMTKGESGLLTLIDSGIIPETPHLPELQTWDDLLWVINTLTTQDHGYKTFVLDTLNGAERLCHEHVCAREYGGQWGKTGFTNYNAGYDVSLADWRQLLVALDKLRETKRMMVMLLCHTKIKNFKNPTGPDFDRYTPDMHEKTWGITHKWADIILFANFEVFTTKEGARTKGIGGKTRMIYTVRDAAYDAGNRHNLAESIDMGEDGKAAWNNFSKAMIEAKGGNKS